VRANGSVCGERGVVWGEASTDKSRRPRGWGRLRGERRGRMRFFEGQSSSGLCAFIVVDGMVK
jgi:hypothetical protein